MKVAQLIKQLQDAQDKYGNLDVCFTDMGDGGYVEIGKVSPSYPWKAEQLGVEDKEADPAFIEINPE